MKKSLGRTFLFHFSNNFTDSVPSESDRSELMPMLQVVFFFVNMLYSDVYKVNMSYCPFNIDIVLLKAP